VHWENPVHSKLSTHAEPRFPLLLLVVDPLPLTPLDVLVPDVPEDEPLDDAELDVELDVELLGPSPFTVDVHARGTTRINES
jgi:hypothetical protein